MKWQYIAWGCLALAGSPASSTELIKDQLDSGFAKYLQEIPQCASMVVAKALSVQDGTAWSYDLQGQADFTMLVEVQSQQVKSITVDHRQEFPDAMQDMLCVTYSLIRTLQPDLSNPEDAFMQAQGLWAVAKTKPVQKNYLFNSFKVQSHPVKLTVR